MNVLLIFENIPEDRDIYYIPNVDEETLCKLKKCHNQFINMCNNEETNEVLNWMYDEFIEDEKIEQCKLSGTEPIELGNVSMTVIVTGMII